MAKQIHLIYDDTDPFPGFIYQNFVGRIDPDTNNSLRVLLESAANSSPNMHLVYLPWSAELPNAEEVKYDVGTNSLIPIESGQVTPSMAYESEQQSLYNEMIDLINNTSYADIDGIVTNQFGDHTAGQQNILKKIITICLHYGKKVVR